MISMIVKAVVVLLLLVILYSLGSALVYMVRPKQGHNTDAMVKALSWRIGLSLAVFFILLGGFYMGWITPHLL